MNDIVGSVPLYATESGTLYVDQGDINDGVGSIEPRDRGSRRDRRTTRKLARLGKRETRLLARLEDDEDDAQVSEVDTVTRRMEVPADIYAAAAANGMITESQYEGLGSASIAALGTGALSDTVNRNIWVKSIVLDSEVDGIGFLLVTAITFAGLPVNVGSLGAPLRTFSHDSTRFGINFGRRLVSVGQQIRITFSNVGAAAYVVSGDAICDELNPYAAQKWMEQMLLQAAVSGFQGF